MPSVFLARLAYLWQCALVYLSTSYICFFCYLCCAICAQTKIACADTHTHSIVHLSRYVCCSARAQTKIACADTHTHTHTHTHTRTHTQMYAPQVRPPKYNCAACRPQTIFAPLHTTHTHTHTNTQNFKHYRSGVHSLNCEACRAQTETACADTHRHSRTHTRTHTHIHTYAQTLTHTHSTHNCIPLRSGFQKYELCSLPVTNAGIGNNSSEVRPAWVKEGRWPHRCGTEWNVFESRLTWIGKGRRLHRRE